MNTTLDMVPTYDVFKRCWNVLEVDDQGCAVFEYDFDTEIQALDFIDDWIAVTNK